MNKAFLLLIFALLLVFAVGVVSAKTVVAGKIYNADYTDTYKDANVTVSCKHESTTTSLNTLSKDEGVYAVEFTTAQCDKDDTVSVSAFLGDLTGENEGKVIDENLLGLAVNLGVVNVALIPEFSLIAGALTVLSAIVVFFIVRRK